MELDAVAEAEPNVEGRCTFGGGIRVGLSLRETNGRGLNRSKTEWKMSEKDF